MVRMPSSEDKPLHAARLWIQPHLRLSPPLFSFSPSQPVPSPPFPPSPPTHPPTYTHTYTPEPCSPCDDKLHAVGDSGARPGATDAARPQHLRASEQGLLEGARRHGERVSRFSLPSQHWRNGCSATVGEGPRERRGGFVTRHDTTHGLLACARHLHPPLARSTWSCSRTRGPSTSRRCTPTLTGSWTS